jgi:hypothetical protein
MMHRRRTGGDQAGGSQSADAQQLAEAALPDLMGMKQGRESVVRQADLGPMVPQGQQTHHREGKTCHRTKD